MAGLNGQVGNGKIYTNVKGRFQELDQTELTRMMFQRQGMPDNVRVIDSVDEIQQSLIKFAGAFLRNADIAYRRDRRYQREMRRDPDIMSPLLQRQLSVALLPWSIVPEDEKDETQQDQADQLQTLIASMPRITEFFRTLSEAVWYGKSATNVIYDRVREGIAPVDWDNFHPDSLTYTVDGDLALLVSQLFPGEKSGGPDGMYHPFDPVERSAIVHHRYMSEAPNFDDGDEAQWWYGGRGLRDIVYYTWMVKQKALQSWVTYTERYGMGIREFNYPISQPNGKDKMVELAKNMFSDVTAVIPKDPDFPEGYGMTIHEPAQGKQQIFADLIEGYLAGQIKELLIGQTATTEATATGLGSDVASKHAKTFERLITYDSKALADTLTHEMVRVLHEMNFGDTPYRPRFEFSVEDTDVDQKVVAMERAVKLGLEVSKREARQLLGFEDPNEDDETLELQPQETQNPFAGSNAGFSQSRDTFRKALQ